MRPIIVFTLAYLFIPLFALTGLSEENAKMLTGQFQSFETPLPSNSKAWEEQKPTIRKKPARAFRGSSAFVHSKSPRDRHKGLWRLYVGEVHI